MGGIALAPKPFVIRDTPASAMIDAVSFTSASLTIPKQNPWLIVTFPFNPDAFVFSQIERTERIPISPGSCRWISIPTLLFLAMSKRASSCPKRSLSITFGSIPPIKSAHISTASSKSAIVPCERTTPLCGKATISIETRSSYFSLTASIPSSLFSRMSGSTSI